jgi:pyruvate, water dikinase
MPISDSVRRVVSTAIRPGERTADWRASMRPKREEETRRSFPSPFAVEIPAECAGWEELYVPHAVFAEDRCEHDEGRFWFQDSLHFPEPFHPFDAVVQDFVSVGLSQASTRLFVIPPSKGIEYRLLNGYVYLSSSSVTDEAELARRAEVFARRGGFYYENWAALDERWREKVQAEIAALESLEVPELPEFEDESVVAEGRGHGAAHALVVAFDRLMEAFDRLCHYHFELVNLGYGAYLAFYELCRRSFTGIPDQAVAKMVSAIDVLALRPDEELRRLAHMAHDLGVEDRVSTAATENELRAALGDDGRGQHWLAAYDRAKRPWFNFSYGNGLYHHHRSWIDDTTLPIGMIGSYLARIGAGDDVAPPRAALRAERDRITREYSDLLPGELRPAFDAQLELARTVFPHIEDHNFYVDHWAHTVFWNKVREFGALLAEHGFLEEFEDVFYLRHDELRIALADLRLQWSSGGAGCPRGPGYWPPIVTRRKRIHEAMRAWVPPPSLGRAPGVITDPVTIMHWGITTERVEEWLATSDEEQRDTLVGLPGSPGVAEGVARVVRSPEHISQIREGEILIASSTSTSWTPVFSKISGAVLDTGGVMCHAAIIAREYGLPAVLGTGTATKRIRTGDRIRIDADAGIVTLLGRPQT